MRPHFYLSALTGILILMTSPLGAHAQSWQAFTPPGGGFTVLVPDTPTEKRGPDEVGYELRLPGDKADLKFGYVDLPRDYVKGKTPEELLDEFSKDVNAAREGKAVLAEKTLTPAGDYPGREYLVRQTRGGEDEFTRLRVYMAANGRAYLLAVIARTRAVVEGEEAERFFNSFRLATVRPDPPVVPPKTEPRPQPRPQPVTPPAKERAVRYQTFRDPTFDHAFTAQIPAGWKVRGGTYHPLGIRLLTAFRVKAESPDGEASINLCVNEPPYVQMLQGREYLPRGMKRLPITGVGQVTIMDYQPGAAYVKAFPLSPGQQLGAPEDWPQLGAALSRVPGFEQVDVGEVAYTVVRGGRQYRGAAFVITRIYDSGSGAPSLWHCLWLASYEAAPQREEEAKAALVRLVGTWSLDPMWLQRQQQADRASLAILMEAGQHTAKVTSEAYWQRDKTYRGIFRGYAEAFRGTVQLRDQRTGQEYTMPNGSNYYWIRPNGERLGTADNRPPAHDAEPLLIVDVRKDG